jgi:hypothetical protein
MRLDYPSACNSCDQRDILDTSITEITTEPERLRGQLWTGRPKRATCLGCALDSRSDVTSGSGGRGGGWTDA